MIKEDADITLAIKAMIKEDADITLAIEVILQIFLRFSIEEQNEMFNLVNHRMTAIRSHLVDDLEAQLEEITLKLEKVKNSKNFKNENHGNH